MTKPYIPNDKWSQRAAVEGYRARSVYKLMELDERFRLLKPGMTVIDIGAAPGSWLQYAATAVGPSGKVIGFDLQQIELVADNVSCHQIDLTNTGLVEAMLKQEGVTSVDLVLSEIAPATSGVKDVDQWRSIELAQHVVALAKHYLKPHCKCVVKIFRGADFDEFLLNVKSEWKTVKITNVQASRDRSREIYLVVTKP